ncbi:MAG: hypothetical protein OXD46_01470 [Chloroflexi bacterium]|nr:hypothetical protein [Chloroflexota bacterium]
MNRVGWLRVALLVTAALFAVATLPVAAQEAVQYREVSGNIINGTTNSLPPFGITVTLHLQTANNYEESTTITDTKGNFSFENIPLDPDALYGVTVRYQGVVYGTDIDLRPESLPPVTVTIYETSDDQSLLSVSSSSLLIPQVDKIARDIYALEIVNVVNASDRTYVPGAEPMNLLRFGLPPGAKGLQIDTSLVGADAIQVDRGFAVPANIPPGEHEVMFAYHFGYEGESVAFDKSYLYGAENARILVPYEIGDLSSVDFGAPGDVEIGDKHYQLIEVSGIARQSRAKLEISSLPQATLWDKTRATVSNVPYELAAPALLGLLMTSLIAIAVARRGGVFAGAMSAGDFREESGDRGAIIAQIADLERALEEGKLREADYFAKRQALLDRLATLPLSPSTD